MSTAVEETTMTSSQDPQELAPSTDAPESNGGGGYPMDEDSEPEEPSGSRTTTTSSGGDREPPGLKTGNGRGGEEDLPTRNLSAAQRRAVDAAFERLFGYPWGTSFALLPPGLTPEQRLLVRILGPEAAAKLRVWRVGVGRRRAANPARIPSEDGPTMTTATKSGAAIEPSERSLHAKAAMASSQGTPSAPPQPATMHPSAAAAIPAVAVAGAVPVGGVDKVLAELSGGRSGPTTIAKTSADWEAFKGSSGLGAAIEERAQSKDAFLHRQDFLARVDLRRFEQEKGERDRERAKRGTT